MPEAVVSARPIRAARSMSSISTGLPRRPGPPRPATLPSGCGSRPAAPLSRLQRARFPESDDDAHARAARVRVERRHDRSPVGVGPGTATCDRPSRWWDRAWAVPSPSWPRPGCRGSTGSCCWRRRSCLPSPVIICCRPTGSRHGAALGRCRFSTTATTKNGRWTSSSTRTRCSYDAFAAQFAQPTLIFQGRRDASVDYRTVERFASGRPNVTLSLLDDDHSLVAQPCRASGTTSSLSWA